MTPSDDFLIDQEDGSNRNLSFGFGLGRLNQGLPHPELSRSSIHEGCLDLASESILLNAKAVQATIPRHGSKGHRANFAAQVSQWCNPN
jgi:hypothetical protein